MFQVTHAIRGRFHKGLRMINQSCQAKCDVTIQVTVVTLTLCLAMNFIIASRNRAQDNFDCFNHNKQQ